jgi:hypothetical protein
MKSIFCLTLFVLLFSYNVICEESIYNLKCLHATGDCTVLDDYPDIENVDKVISVNFTYTVYSNNRLKFGKNYKYFKDT